MRLPRVVVKRACALCLLFATTNPLVAYEETLHLSLTMALADMAGFSNNDAYEIAKYDRATDDDPTTDPVDFVRRARDRAPLRAYHFGPSEVIETRRGEALACDGSSMEPAQYKRIGQFLHALEDSYSHRASIAMGWIVHNSAGNDLPWNDPDAFVVMFQAKFEDLLAIRKKCVRDLADGAAQKQADGARQKQFDAKLESVRSWAQVERENPARGKAPDRFRALEQSLYGPRFEDYVAGASKAYAGWLQQQRDKNWEEQ